MKHYLKCAAVIAIAGAIYTVIATITHNSHKQHKQDLKQTVNTQAVFGQALILSKKYVPVRFIQEAVNASLKLDNGLLVLALVTVESHFDPFARSSSGAIGCAQVKPPFWHDELKQAGIVSSYRDYRDPAICPKIAGYILNKLIRKYGDIETALAVYNCGPNNKRCVKTQGKKFANKVLAIYAKYAIAVNDVNKLKKEVTSNGRSS